MTLTPHPLLVPWSRKRRAIPLLPLWAVRPVQSLYTGALYLTLHRAQFVLYILSNRRRIWQQMKKCYNRHYSAKLRGGGHLDKSITRYMLFHQFQYLGTNLVVPTAFEVNVMFLKKFVKEMPWKITLFMFVA